MATVYFEVTDKLDYLNELKKVKYALIRTSVGKICKINHLILIIYVTKRICILLSCFTLKKKCKCYYKIRGLIVILDAWGLNTVLVFPYSILHIFKLFK